MVRPVGVFTGSPISARFRDHTLVHVDVAKTSSVADAATASEVHVIVTGSTLGAMSALIWRARIQLVVAFSAGEG